jgi:hypothetical protein
LARRGQLKEYVMSSFRNPLSLVAAAALAWAIGVVGVLNHGHIASNAIARNAHAAPGSTSSEAAAVQAVSPPEAVIRASTYADEIANTNHEGF